MADNETTKVLIIDDDPLSLHALQALLADLELEVMSAASGRQALRQVLRHEFALILLDVNMPELDGFETAAMIRQRRRSYRTPIVFLTADNAAQTYMFKGYEVGAVDYLVKPVMPEVLRCKVAVFVDLYKKSVEIRRQREHLRVAARASKQRFYDLVQGLDAIVWEADALDHCFSFVSQRAENILGYPVREWLEHHNFRSRLIHEQDLAHAMAFYREAAAGFHGSREVVYRTVAHDGAIVWVRDNVRVVRDELGRPLQLRGVMVDITAHKKAEERLAQMAHYDALTGLPNRNLLENRLAAIMARRSEDKGPAAAVLFLDIDRFKYINDTMGHNIGDALLRTVASRLKGNIRDHDMVVRLGGDEFIVVIDMLSEPREAAAVAEKLRRALAEPISLHGEEIGVTCSIGVSFFPEDGRDAITLLKNADIAMYAAKEAGKNGYRFYESRMNTHASQRRDMERALCQALKHREFILHYQPKLDLATGRIAGLEALLRWHRPDGPIMGPEEFIPLLEETGLILPVGEWALLAACTQNALWRDQGSPPVRIGVNLSRRQLQQKGLTERIKGILADASIAPDFLELEITESMVMEDVDRAAHVLEQLKDTGITITMDDFGTGHSSLSSLKRFPIDNLKVDKSFIHGFPAEADASIATAIISMGKSLGMRVIAEGVENEMQIQMLKNLGCDEVQGNFVCPPSPAPEILRLLRDERHGRDTPLQAAAGGGARVAWGS